jgi:hypothetical protein
MVLPLQAVLLGQILGLQNQEILSIAGCCGVGEIKTARDDCSQVNHHHFIVNCNLICVTWYFIAHIINKSNSIISN